jgi:hypothetical protein
MVACVNLCVNMPPSLTESAYLVFERYPVGILGKESVLSFLAVFLKNLQLISVKCDIRMKPRISDQQRHQLLSNGTVST